MQSETYPRGIEWGVWIAVGIGLLLFLLGLWRFFEKRHFGFYDLLYCCLAIIPAGLLLLVFDYVVHHARLVAVMVLFIALVLVFSSPVFDVALGVTLLGAIAVPAVGEWKQAKQVGRKDSD